MGMAEIAQALWLKHLKHNPANPQWIDRDRVVISNGHGSMLPYSVLHLCGYDISLDDLKSISPTWLAYTRAILNGVIRQALKQPLDR